MADGDERELVAKLRAGDTDEFRRLVSRHHGSMVRLAAAFVPSAAVAEEVVQDSWIAVIKGIDKFEGRSSVRTWISRIVVNQAKRRGERERRTVPMSSLAAAELDNDEPAVPGARFAGPAGRGAWQHPPSAWADTPEARALAHDTVEQVADAVDRLPTALRQVIVLRDLAGWEAPEVCAQLAISEANQRVLLHRARSRVRARLERHFEGAR